MVLVVVSEWAEHVNPRRVAEWLDVDLNEVSVVGHRGCVLDSTWHRGRHVSWTSSVSLSRCTLHLFHLALCPARLASLGCINSSLFLCLGLANGELQWDIRERKESEVGIFILPGPFLQNCLRLLMSLVWRAQPLSGSNFHRVHLMAPSSSLQVYG